jgi:hypothetical protein
MTPEANGNSVSKQDLGKHDGTGKPSPNRMDEWLDHSGLSRKTPWLEWTPSIQACLSYIFFKNICIIIGAYYIILAYCIEINL